MLPLRLVHVRRGQHLDRLLAQLVSGLAEHLLNRLISLENPPALRHE